MADEVIQMEARLNNLISVEAKKIRDDLASMERGAKKSFQESSKGASSFLGTLKGFVGAQAIIGATRQAWRALSGTVSESIRLYGEQEKAEAKVSAAIKSTGGIAGVTSSELKDMARAMQSVTTFGDETVLRGQSMLLTFTKIGKDVFPQATETMLNLSAAMGTDVQQSAIQLGKALNDPVLGVTALRRVGIQLSAQQEEQIKTFVKSNDIIGAQKIILGELETQFGGLARAVAENGTGQLEQFENKVGDVKERLGKALIPALNSIISGLEKHFIPAIENGINALDRFLNPKGAVIDDEIKSIQNEIDTLNKSIVYMRKTGSESVVLSTMFGGSEITTLKDAISQVDILNEKLNGLKGETPSAGGTPPIPSLTPDEEEELKKQEELQQKLIQQAGQYWEESIQQAVDATNKKFEMIAAEEDAARKRLQDATLEAQFENDELIIEQLKLRHERELEEIGASEQAKADLIKAHELELANARKDIAEKTEDQILSARQQAAMGFLNLTKTVFKAIGKENKAAANVAKGIAIVEATINTFLAASKANSATPYPPVNAALMALAIAQGLAQVAMISAQSFQTGGIVAGNSFTGDNIPARVNSGEMILTREQQTNLFNQLNRQGGRTSNTSLNLTINGPVDQTTLPSIQESMESLAMKFEQAGREGLIDFRSIGLVTL